MMIMVVGRHALLFDDDSNASFVNSAAALVEWNSLSIDRYDVRHLLSAPPPRVKRRHNLSPLRRPESPSQSELDHERFLDLPSTSPSEEEHKQDDGAGPVNDGSYRAVPFSYGSADEPSGDRNADAESVFRPPFSLPENLLQNLPPTEKVHQIIARTAMFVSKHGGQSEIVLRVKQGDNPTFGFLMPDHHLHDYFRFLVDHPELLSEENKMDSELEQTSGAGRGGALSLLGSVYGSGEDEDGADEDAPELKRNGSEDAVAAANATVLNQSERTTSPAIVAGKDETVSKLSLLPLKEKMPLIKRNQSISTVKTRTSSGMKKDGDALGSVGLAADKSQVSASPSMSKVEPPIVEPPSDVKRVIDKIVEFVLRNGKEFEAVLVEQDRKHGRFPFLLPSNLYYPYYRKVVRKAEESKLPGKGFSSEKHDSTGLGMDKKRATSKESDTLSIGSDIPYDSDRKEKFKMVIGKLKKDGQDPPTKAATQTNVGVTVDAAAAAAILQAATRGIRNCNLEILTRMSLNGSGQGPSGEGGQGSSASVPVANATSEADSSEANLTKPPEAQVSGSEVRKERFRRMKRKKKKKTSVDLSKSSSYQDGRASSQPSNTSEVSDDLRAKIRAMLMATFPGNAISDTGNYYKHNWRHYHSKCQENEDETYKKASFIIVKLTINCTRSFSFVQSYTTSKVVEYFLIHFCNRRSNPIFTCSIVKCDFHGLIFSSFLSLKQNYIYTHTSVLANIIVKDVSRSIWLDQGSVEYYKKKSCRSSSKRKVTDLMDKDNPSGRGGGDRIQINGIDTSDDSGRDRDHASRGRIVSGKRVVSEMDFFADHKKPAAASSKEILRVVDDVKKEKNKVLLLGFSDN
ncbi:hypothetical protein JRO89_XS15G0163500 [Xanthoceras sorbifolium]|uniref:SURP motif domain-containing protein n=1 Tax=Xanthoceras sorbifolium TaxID=99658 RepID=A0ABQ8H2G1_9ROSI|nr:hypothetical protein JRO89_XS15G0163500 [Xanthoceras sorbifolium]